jgi:hypothetical protein
MAALVPFDFDLNATECDLVDAIDGDANWPGEFPPKLRVDGAFPAPSRLPASAMQGLCPLLTSQPLMSTAACQNSVACSAVAASPPHRCLKPGKVLECANTG